MLKSKHYCSPNSDRPNQKESTTENTPIQSLYIDYKYNKIIDIVMQTEIERNKGR